MGHQTHSLGNPSAQLVHSKIQEFPFTQHHTVAGVWHEGIEFNIECHSPSTLWVTSTWRDREVRALINRTIDRKNSHVGRNDGTEVVDTKMVMVLTKERYLTGQYFDIN